MDHWTWSGPIPQSKAANRKNRFHTINTKKHIHWHNPGSYFRAKCNNCENNTLMSVHWIEPQHCFMTIIMCHLFSTHCVWISNHFITWQQHNKHKNICWGSRSIVSSVQKCWWKVHAQQTNWNDFCTGRGCTALRMLTLNCPALNNTLSWLIFRTRHKNGFCSALFRWSSSHHTSAALCW